MSGEDSPGASIASRCTCRSDGIARLTAAYHSQHSCSRPTRQGGPSLRAVAHLIDSGFGYCSFALAQQLGEFPSSQWRTEQVALPKGTAVLLEEFELFPCFNAFRNDPHM